MNYWENLKFSVLTISLFIETFALGVSFALSFESYLLASSFTVSFFLGVFALDFCSIFSVIVNLSSSSLVFSSDYLLINLLSLISCDSAILSICTSGASGGWDTLLRLASAWL